MILTQNYGGFREITIALEPDRIVMPSQMGLLIVSVKGSPFMSSWDQRFLSNGCER